jgi:hypothetical protein
MTDVRTHEANTGTTTSSRPRATSREADETRCSFTTTEFYVWEIATAGLQLAGYINRSGLDEKTAWQLATLVSVAYIVSRGLVEDRLADAPDDRHAVTTGTATVLQVTT